VFEQGIEAELRDIGKRGRIAMSEIDRNASVRGTVVSIMPPETRFSVSATAAAGMAPGTDLNTVTATISDLAFGGVSTYQALAAGSYEVLFTTPANGGKFIEIDSGTLSLTAGQVRTVVGLNVQAGGFTDTILADLN